jgi:hypothetical protein
MSQKNLLAKIQYGYHKRRIRCSFRTSYKAAKNFMRKNLSTFATFSMDFQSAPNSPLFKNNIEFLQTLKRKIATK